MALNSSYKGTMPIDNNIALLMTYKQLKEKEAFIQAWTEEALQFT